MVTDFATVAEPSTPREPCSRLSLLTSKVLRSVAEPSTSRVLLRAVAPLTSIVPDTTTAPVDRVMMSVSPLTPIAFAVNRTLSTSTYALVLVMASPVVPVCVRAAAFSDSTRSSARVVIPDTPRVPATATAPLDRVMMSVSPLTPIAFAVNRTLSTSTCPLVLVMASPVVPVCVSAALLFDIVMSSARAVLPTTARVLRSVAEPSTPREPCSRLSLLTSKVLRSIAAPSTPSVLPISTAP